MASTATQATRTPSAGRPSRRDQILREAVAMFRQRGYHAASMDDIGAAVGISGPALYRHFSSKEDLFVAGLREVMVELRAGLRRAAALPPAEALAELVSSHVDTVLGHSDAIALALDQQHVLSPGERRKLRRDALAQDRAWTKTLLQVRPELDEEQALTLVGVAVAAVNHLAYGESRLDPASLAALVRSAAAAVLAAPVPTAT